MHLAIRSMWMLGAVMMALGVTAVGPRIFLVISGGIGLPVPIAFAIVCNLVPAVLFLFSGYHLRRGRQWAIITGIVPSGILALLFAAATVLIMLGAIMDLNPMIMIVGVVPLLFTVAFVQLIYLLAKSFESLRRLHNFEPRGFEPLMNHNETLQPTNQRPDGDSDAASPHG